MNSSFGFFERVVRNAPGPEPHEIQVLEPADAHPFETRNIHPDLPKKVRRLFDDGYTAEAVFEAFKYVEKEVRRISKISGKTGYKLMTDAFNDQNPKIKLNQLSSDSDKDEQRGFMELFGGAVTGIRNPRGHEVEIMDDPGAALDYLALASLLLRKLDSCGAR